jgi:hypothetical protein
MFRKCIQGHASCCACNNLALPVASRTPVDNTMPLAALHIPHSLSKHTKAPTCVSDSPSAAAPICCIVAAVALWLMRAQQVCTLPSWRSAQLTQQQPLYTHPSLSVTRQARQAGSVACLGVAAAGAARAAACTAVAAACCRQPAATTARILARGATAATERSG